MKTSIWWLRIFSLAMLLVCAGSATRALGQEPPPMSARHAQVPGKAVPTGFAANGGAMTNGVYSNSIYRFSLNVPPGWAVVPPSTEKPPVAAQAHPVVGHQTNRVLLIMTENAPFKKSVERRALQIIATRMPSAPGPTAAEGFITYSERTAREQGLNVKYEHSPERLTIHEQPFSKATMTQTTDGAEQHIEQYVTTHGDDLLQFIIISPTAEGLKDLQPNIQSLQFKAAEPAKSARKLKKKATAQP